MNHLEKGEEGKGKRGRWEEKEKEEKKGEVRWRNGGKIGAEGEEGREEVGHDKPCCIENEKDHMAGRTTGSI